MIVQSSTRRSDSAAGGIPDTASQRLAAPPTHLTIEILSFTRAQPRPSPCYPDGLLGPEILV